MQISKEKTAYFINYNCGYKCNIEQWSAYDEIHNK